jgi:hypothetical protein
LLTKDGDRVAVVWRFGGVPRRAKCSGQTTIEPNLLCHQNNAAMLGCSSSSSTQRHYVFAHYATKNTQHRGRAVHGLDRELSCCVVLLSPLLSSSSFFSFSFLFTSHPRVFASWLLLQLLSHPPTCRALGLLQVSE